MAQPLQGLITTPLTSTSTRKKTSSSTTKGKGSKNSKKKKMSAPDSLEKLNDNQHGQLPTLLLSQPPTENELKWLQLFTSLNDNLQAIRKDLSELKGIKGKIETFSQEWKENTDDKVNTCTNQVESHDFKLKLLTNVVIRQEERIEILERRLTSMHLKDLKPNLIIRGLIEESDEECEDRIQAVKDFFKNEMQIEEE